MTMNTTDVWTNMSSHNITENSTFGCQQFEGWNWIYTYQPIFMWIIFVLGFIENIFVLGVFLLHRNRCTVAEIYLGNLAAADLLLICGLPFWAINISNKLNWPFGSFLCKAVNIVILINLYSSIYFLMMVSIDRYLALVKTMSIGRMRTAWCAKVNCAIIWVFAILVSMPKTAFRTVTYVEHLNVSACILAPPSDYWFLATNIIMNIVGFLIPVAIISFCTIQITNVLKSNTMQQFKEVNNEKKATKLILAVLLVFIVCWLPFHIVTFVDSLLILKVTETCGVISFIQIGSQISSYCGYSNSCINPLLYVIVGNHFRRKAKEVYKQFQARNHKTPSKEQMEYSGDTIRTSISMGTTKNKIVF